MVSCAFFIMERYYRHFCTASLFASALSQFFSDRGETEMDLLFEMGGYQSSIRMAFRSFRDIWI